jgi:hypothetical protein
MAYRCYAAYCIGIPIHATREHLGLGTHGAQSYGFTVLPHVPRPARRRAPEGGDSDGPRGPWGCAKPLRLVKVNDSVHWVHRAHTPDRGLIEITSIYEPIRIPTKRHRK